MEIKLSHFAEIYTIEIGPSAADIRTQVNNK